MGPHPGIVLRSSPFLFPLPSPCPATAHVPDLAWYTSPSCTVPGYLPFDPLGLRQFQRRFLAARGPTTRLRQRFRRGPPLDDRSIFGGGGGKKMLSRDRSNHRHLRRTLSMRRRWRRRAALLDYEKAWKILYYLRADRLLAVDRR